MELAGEWIRSDVIGSLRKLLDPDLIDWPAFAEKHGFDLASLDDPKGVVPLTASFSAFEEVAELLGHDAAMFELYYKVDIGSFSLFDYLFACAPSLREACKAWVKFIPIRTNAYQLGYEETKTGASIEWPVLEGRGEWRQSVFARIAWAMQQIEQALDMPNPPVLIEIATSEPVKTTLFQSNYKGRIRFNALRNRISIPESLLNQKLRKTDRHLYEIILRSATSELESFGQIASPVSRIANEVSNGLADGTWSLPHVAAKLGMSPRAVQRHLENEGTNFRKLTEGIRRSAAERYLKSSNMPLKEIAYLLGFSELSTFSRAVKTWFGVSPRKVRESFGQAAQSHKPLKAPRS